MIWPDTLLTSYQWVYHNVSPCHFSDRIHVSLIIKLTYSQIYFWGGDGLPSPPFCDGSDLDSYTVMLCCPVGRFPHHCFCLKRQLSRGEWLKEEDPRCSFETVKQSTPRLIGAELFTWPSRESKCPPDVFHRPKNQQFLQIPLVIKYNWPEHRRSLRSHENGAAILWLWDSPCKVAHFRRKFYNHLRPAKPLLYQYI